jgi:predicted DNA-binding transcriptional regulator AlpA
MKTEQNQISKNWENVSPTGRMLRPNEVIATTGLSRSQIYSMISNREFPPFIKLSARASALPEAWLEAFIALRVAGTFNSVNRINEGGS